MSSADSQMPLETAIKSAFLNNLSEPLDPATSHKVFHTSLPYVHLSEEFIETLAKYVQVFDINMDMLGMRDAHIRVFNSQNLTSLQFGRFFPQNSSRYWKNATTINLDAILKDALNQNSRQQLTKLDLFLQEDAEGFAAGWAKALGLLLPSLTHLGLHGRPLTEFPMLCSSCPNLQLLDLTNTGITAFTGISNLRNLQTLKVGCLRIEEPAESSEFFELRELWSLSFECRAGICARCRDERSSRNWYMKSGRSLPKLEFVDFTGSRIEDYHVEQFLTDHPTVRTISVGYEELENLDYPHVTVFHHNSVKSVVECLKFHAHHKDISMIKRMINELNDVLHNNDNNTSQEDLQKCWNGVCSVAEDFSTVEGVQRYALRLFQQIFELICLDDVSSEDRLKAVEVFSDILAQSLGSLSQPHLHDVFKPWNILESRELILETPGVDYDRLARLAMLFLEKTDKGIHENWPHVMVLDMVLERVNAQSDEFEICEIENVLNNLEMISKKRGVDSTIRKAAKNAMNFVLNNFPVFE